MIQRHLLVFGLPTLLRAENPIRKVVTLLQNLAEEVDKEGETERKLFDEFMCYCTSNKSSSSAEIEKSTNRVESLRSSIKELTGSNSQLTSEISELEKELSDNQKSVDQAMKVRTQEENQYHQESGDLKTSIASLDHAIPALRKGLEAMPSLLQSLRPTFVQYQSLLSAANQNGAIARLNQGDVLMLMQNGSSAKGSGEILGILETMRDNFKENLLTAVKEEEESRATFHSLMSGKKKEISAAQTEIEEKKERRASQMQLKADNLEDLEDTTENLKTSQSFLRELNKSCDERGKDFDNAEKARAKELEAIQETIKILNDDDSLEAFNKTLPKPEEEGGKEEEQPPAFLQFEDRELDVGGISFLMQGSVTKKDKFWKLKKMVNKMIESMVQEQEADDKKKNWCEEEIDATNAELAEVKDHIVHTQQEFESGNRERVEVEESLEVVRKELAQIEKAMADATAQRKKEAAVYLQTRSELQVATQLLKKARDRLAEQYQNPNPQSSLMQSPQRQEDRDTADMLGLSFIQVGKGDRNAAGNGILSMIDELRKDLDVEATALKVGEQAAVKDFKDTMANGKDSKESKSNDIVNKSATLGRIKEQIGTARQKLKETGEEKLAIENKLLSIHKNCDFLIGSYEQRKKARATELDGLQKSLAILSGADFDVATTTPEPPEELETTNKLLQVQVRLHEQ